MGLDLNNKMKSQIAASELFLSTEERIKRQHSQEITEIEIKLLNPHPKNPYRVQDGDKMEQLKASIEVKGVLEPIVVREHPTIEDEYEILSGHSRTYACKSIGKERIPALVIDCDDATAEEIVADSNIFREDILPSERAKAFKLKYDAMLAQGKRNDLIDECNGCRKLPDHADDHLAREYGVSVRTVHNYLRLNYLIPDLLDEVDEKKLGFRQAVEMSYLSKDEQSNIYKSMMETQAVPSHAQTKEMRKISDAGKLTDKTILDIMTEKKPNQKEKYHIEKDKFKRFVTDGMSNDDFEAWLLKAAAFYAERNS